MTTHVEHGTIRSAGLPPFTNLTAAIRTRFKAWRAQQIERAQIEALEALAPEILDDIGVRIAKAANPPNFIPVFNPYALVVAAVFAPRPADRDEL
jgi:hypothetical protein